MNPNDYAPISEDEIQRRINRRAPTAQHTPGPWTIEDEGAGIFCVSGRGSTVAGEVVGAPDARLIAAAPELLAVARMVVAWGDSSVGRLTTMERRMIEDARAAIAKAEGRD